MTQLAERTQGLNPEQTAILETVLVDGDLSKLTPQDRTKYYLTVCDSVGLNPFTQPFAYIRLNNKLTLYALKGATDQIRDIRKISVYKLERDLIDDILNVTAYGRTQDGREDSSTGAVSVKGLAGEARANAFMKAETKAKRRLTLSIAGLGMLDESEVDSIPNAQRVDLASVQELPRQTVVEPARVNRVAQEPISNVEARTASLEVDTATIPGVSKGIPESNDQIEQGQVVRLARAVSPLKLEDAKRYQLYGCFLDCEITSGSQVLKSQFKELLHELEDFTDWAVKSGTDLNEIDAAYIEYMAVKP